MENINWPQVGAFLVPMLSLGLAGLAYLTRQFNRLGDRMGNIEQRQARLEERVDERFKRVDDRLARMNERMDERFEHMNERMDERFERIEETLSQLQDENKSLIEGLQNVEKEQARMLGFLEGRGVMGKAPAGAAETA